MDRHLENCSAPICNQSDYKNVIWYVGELICKRKPYTKIQEVQLWINDQLRRKKWKGQEFFKGSDLEKQWKPKMKT
jgi:hypothetical protein